MNILTEVTAENIKSDLRACLEPPNGCDLESDFRKIAYIVEEEG